MGYVFPLFTLQGWPELLQKSVWSIKHCFDIRNLPTWRWPTESTYPSHYKVSTCVDHRVACYYQELRELDNQPLFGKRPLFSWRANTGLEGAILAQSYCAWQHSIFVEYCCESIFQNVMMFYKSKSLLLQAFLNYFLSESCPNIPNWTPLQQSAFTSTLNRRQSSLKYRIINVIQAKCIIAFKSLLLPFSYL